MDNFDGMVWLICVGGSAHDTRGITTVELSIDGLSPSLTGALVNGWSAFISASWILEV